MAFKSLHHIPFGPFSTHWTEAHDFKLEFAYTWNGCVVWVKKKGGGGGRKKIRKKIISASSFTGIHSWKKKIKKIPQLSTEVIGIIVFQSTNWHNRSCKLFCIFMHTLEKAGGRKKNTGMIESTYHSAEALMAFI